MEKQITSIENFKKCDAHEQLETAIDILHSEEGEVAQ